MKEDTHIPSLRVRAAVAVVVVLVLLEWALMDGIDKDFKPSKHQSSHSKIPELPKSDADSTLHKYKNDKQEVERNRPKPRWQKQGNHYAPVFETDIETGNMFIRKPEPTEQQNNIEP
ncbi:MAG: hypothetical protein QM786_18840 [Breznakibacter sp.]